MSVRNITRIFRSATDEQHAAGMNWYPEANALANFLDPADPRRAAAVIAVLSPRLEWKRNALYARMAYAMVRAGMSESEFLVLMPTMKRNARKAFRLIQNSGSDGSDFEILVRGNKVSNFWFNILDLSGMGVTVDRHAIDIYNGFVGDDDSRADAVKNSAAYNNIAAAYVRAAAILSRESICSGGPVVSPAAVQAVTWVVWRENVAIPFQNARRAEILAARRIARAAA